MKFTPDTHVSKENETLLNPNLRVLPEISDKERVLKQSKTEPLKYVLEIENVTNAEELVDKLAQFETKAGFEDIFAKLKNSIDLNKIKVMFKDLNGLRISSEGSLQGPTYAQYRNVHKTIYIDNVYANSAEIGDFYITVLHELLHGVFQGADVASGMNIIYGLTNIKNTLRKLPIHNKYRHLYSTVLNNASEEDKKKQYGLTSVDEFIAEGYSNPKFQSFLKRVELKNGKDLRHKITDLLLSVATLNARIISKEITEKDAFTAFQKIDLDSLDLLEDFEKNIEAYKKKEAQD